MAKKLSSVMQQNLAYNHEGKREFHRVGMAALRSLAAALGLARGQYDIRSNKGGIAVSGEVTLHTDHLYVQVSQSCLGSGREVLYRTCEGRRDFTGGRNHTAPVSVLDKESMHDFADRLRNLAGQQV